MLLSGSWWLAAVAMSGLELEAAAGKPEVRSLRLVDCRCSFPLLCHIWKPKTWQMMGMCGMYVRLHILTQSNWTPKAGRR